MNRILPFVKYKMNYQFHFSLWYFVIYLILMPIIYIALYKTSYLGPNEGSFIYRIWGVVFFQWAISIRFKEDFDFFLTISNTRSMIFQILSTVAVVFCLIFSAVIVFERVIVDKLNEIFMLQNITDPIFLFSPFANDGAIVQFIFFFMLCLSGSALGILLGSLFYRFGRKFTMAFWLIISTIPIAMLPMLLWNREYSEFLPALGNYLMSFDAIALSGWLLLFTALFGITGFFNIRSLPQK